MLFRVMNVIGILFGVFFMLGITAGCLGFAYAGLGVWFAGVLGVMLVPAVLATGYMQVIDALNDT